MSTSLRRAGDRGDVRLYLRLRGALTLACALAVVVLASGCAWMRAYQSRVAAEEAFARGAEAAARGDLIAAQEEFDRALQAAPDSASLNGRIGLAYMPPVGEPYARIYPAQAEKAFPYLRRALELEARQPQLVYLEAIVAALRAGREDDARQILGQVTARFRGDAMALNNIGYSVVDADQLVGDALPLLQRAVALKPKTGIIVDSLGWAYYRLGNLQRAESLLKQAARRAPREAEIAYHLGVVYSARGRRDDARRQFTRALKIAPDLAPARAALAELDGR